VAAWAGSNGPASSWPFHYRKTNVTCSPPGPRPAKLNGSASISVPNICHIFSGFNLQVFFSQKIQVLCQELLGSINLTTQTEILSSSDLL
jgi:hypothetical protein